MIFTQNKSKKKQNKRKGQMIDESKRTKNKIQTNRKTKKIK